MNLKANSIIVSGSITLSQR